KRDSRQEERPRTRVVSLASCLLALLRSAAGRPEGAVGSPNRPPGWRRGGATCQGKPALPAGAPGNGTNPAATARGTSIFGNNPSWELDTGCRSAWDSRTGSKYAACLPSTT